MHHNAPFSPPGSLTAGPASVATPAAADVTAVVHDLSQQLRELVHSWSHLPPGVGLLAGVLVQSAG